MEPNFWQQHEDLTEELVGLLNERASVNELQVRQSAEVVMQQVANGQNITTARTMATTMTAALEAESIKLTGKIDGLRARIRHAELRMGWSA